MKQTPAIDLSPDLLRKQYHYRTPNPKTGLGEIGCGFYPRPDCPLQRSRTSSSHYGLMYLLQGSGKVALRGGRPLRVKAGDAIQAPPSSSLVVCPDKAVQWVETFVCMDAALMKRVAEIHGLDLKKPVMKIGLDLLLIRQFRQITLELAQATPLSLQEALTQAIALVLTVHQMNRPREAVAEEALIGRACRILESDFAERLGLASVAGALGIGYHHFRRAFRRQLGVSPGQYRIYCRLQRARSLLMHEHRNLAEVARELGYADPFVFSKQFKKGVGRSPSEFAGKNV